MSFQTGSTPPLFNFEPGTTTSPGSFNFGVPRNDNAFKGIHLMIEEKDSLISKQVTCRVCFRKYCVDVLEPKLLVCGHSVCSSCLSDILKFENKMCPKCNKSIENNRIEDFTTNFDVLETVKRISDTIGNQHFYSLKALKELYFSVKNKLSEDIEELKNLEKRVDDDLGEIQKYLDDNTVPHDTAFEFISKMEQNFRNLEITLKKTTLQPTISLEHYKNFKSFLYDLSIRLHNKKERIFTYEIVRGKKKFGEVTLEDGDYITVHALTLDYPTKNACLVQLKDFKKCTDKCMHLFLELKAKLLCCQKLYFACLTFSVVTLQTIKLCTGELGPCYLGSSSVYKNLVLSFKVANHMIGDKDTWGAVDYIPFFVAQTTVPDVATNLVQTTIFDGEKKNVPNVTFIKGFSSGQIEIGSNNIIDRKNVIGKLVTDVSNSVIYNKCRISDCGIAFKLL